MTENYSGQLSDRHWAAELVNYRHHVAQVIYYCLGFLRKELNFIERWGLKKKLEKLP